MIRLGVNIGKLPPIGTGPFDFNPQAQADKGPDFEFRGNIGLLQESNKTEIILTGPTRTGKTLGILAKGWRLANQHADLRCLLIRKQRTDLSETALVTLERDLIGLTNPLVTEGPRRQYRQIYQLDNGSSIVVGGLDKPGKILSSEYDIILVPQAEELMPADWETLITRLSGKSLPPAEQQIVGDCNPASPQHWIMERSLEGSLQLWETYHKDNPLLHDGQDWTEFGKAYLDRLSAALTGNERARLLEGKWVQAEGVVYSEFATENIVDTEPDLNKPTEIALDDGYIHPRVFLLLQQTPQGILVYDEIYHTRHLEETCVRELQDLCAKHSGNELPRELEKKSVEERAIWCRENEVNLPEIACGAPEAKSLHRYLRMADIPVRNVPIPSVVEGIKPVRGLIKDGNGYRALKVHRRCRNFISELTDGYKYPEEGKYRDDDKPLDENNHACDAIRDWVWTRARR